MPTCNELMVRIFKVDPALLTDEAGMAQVPGWDSLSHMNLVLAIESTYQIELTGDEIADLQSVGAVKALLRSKGINP